MIWLAFPVRVRLFGWAVAILWTLGEARRTP